MPTWSPPPQPGGPVQPASNPSRTSMIAVGLVGVVSIAIVGSMGVAMLSASTSGRADPSAASTAPPTSVPNAPAAPRSDPPVMPAPPVVVAPSTAPAPPTTAAGGGEIARGRALPGSAAAGPEGVDPIYADRVASLIRGQAGGIRSCYERSLRNLPTLSGRIEVRFTIGAAGRITSIHSSGMPEAPEVGSCIEGAIRRIAFPQPAGGDAEFTYPFVFTASA